MTNERLKWVLRQMFKLIRQCRSRQNELLRLYLALKEDQRLMGLELDRLYARSKEIEAMVLGTGKDEGKSVN